MRLTSNILITACLCFTVFTEPVLGRIDDDISTEVIRVVETIELYAKNFGYKTVRGYPLSDEWEEEEKKNLLRSHAYYTLFGKNSDDSCLSAEGRIGVTILLFRDAELARHHVALMKEHHLGNMGVKVIKSDENGYYLEEVNGFYAAVIQGEKVIFFEDRSHRQEEVIKSLSETIVKQVR